jgi:alkylation response protein AidB-like acyl-CoA dehydrogenase
VNGQKTWSSGAHRADWGFLLARTNPEEKRSRGLSFFLVDMRTPGITIKPILGLDGSHLFNEVFLDDVRIPAHNMVGEENQGWMASQMTSNFERSMIALFSYLKRELEELVEFCQETKRDGRPLSENPLIRHRLAQMAIEIDIGRTYAYSVLWSQIKGGLVMSAHLAAGAKILATEMVQRFNFSGYQIIGHSAQVKESRWSPLKGRYEKECQQCLGLSMAGGTSEIMRNLICAMGLGLPRSW